MTTQPNEIPRHVALIPDGNRRWAKACGLTTKQGHQRGYEVLKEIADLAFARGIKIITGYVFSTENWNRTKDEVGYLMKLVEWIVTTEAKEYHRKGIKIRILGSTDGLDASMIAKLRGVEELTGANTNGQINLCFNYGGRRDITEAVQKLIKDGVAAGEVDEQVVAAALSSAGLPDPDLIIRTSGEQRLSNFLVWEGAYSELFFSDKLWPDFDEAELDTALEDYAQRKRNFGK